MGVFVWFQIITTAEKAMEMASYAAQPGSFIVDFFPMRENASSDSQYPIAEVQARHSKFDMYLHGFLVQHGRNSHAEVVSLHLIWSMFRLI